MKWALRFSLLALVGSLGACGDSAVSTEEDIGSSSDAVMKGTTGAHVGDSNYCDDPAHPCALGEGDCDTDAQCPGLKCVAGNLAKRGPLTGDACAPSTCGDGIRNGNETSIDCGGDCGSDCTVTCNKPNGDQSKCSTDCRCSVGEGDCDSAAECQNGLICGSSNGPAFGLPAGTDVCWGSTCQNGIKDGTETAVDCGGSCAPCAPPPAGPVAVADVNGTPLLHIVIAPHADPTLQNNIAALAVSLKDKLNAIAGTTNFVIDTPTNTPSGISLGIDGDFPNTGWPYQGFFRPNDLYVNGTIIPERLALQEQYVLRTPANSNRVIVAGATFEGLRNAVWDLLHQVGYRHYFQTDTWEVIPSREPLLSLKLAINEKPAFAARAISFRQTYWNDTSYQTNDDTELARWYEHNRVNPNHALVPTTLYSSVMKYWEQHHGQVFPVALLTGPGSYTSRNFCLTATANGVTALDAVREWAAAQTTPYAISLSPSRAVSGWISSVETDGTLHCNDVNDPIFGNTANRIAAIANAAAEVQPSRVITGLVREYFAESPTIALRQNVFIAVDPETSGATPARSADSFVFDYAVSGWNESGAKDGFIDWFGTNDTELPAQNPLNTFDLTARVRRFYRAGLRQYGLATDSWGLAGPSLWALARSMWDADDNLTSDQIRAKAEEYRSDFFSNAFGATAAPHVKPYYDALESKPLWSEHLVGTLYRALQDALPYATTPKQQARLGDLAMYARYLELYRKAFNRCSAVSPATEQTELKQLLQFVYATRGNKMLHSRDVFAAIEASVPACVGGACTTNGCQNAQSQLTGVACVMPAWGPDCSATACGEIKNGSAYATADLLAFVAPGVANNNVLPGGLTRPFSNDLVPYTPANPNLPRRTDKTFTLGPVSLVVQPPSNSGTLQVHVKKNVPNSVSWGQLSDPFSHAVVGQQALSRGAELTDWIFSPASSGAYRLDLDDQAKGLFTSFAQGTRVAIPTNLATPPTAFGSPWSAYFMVPAGTTNVVGWSQADGAFFRYRKKPDNTWETPPIQGYLSDYAVGHACTTPRIVADTSPTKALNDHFVIPIPTDKPVTSDEIWLFNDGPNGTLGQRALLSVPPYLYRATEEMLVPREVANPTSCTNSSSCPTGQYCSQAGVCRTEGSSCVTSADCLPNYTCQAGACQAPDSTPTCTNGIKDGSESDVDCGGTCGPCSLGQQCDGACEPGLVCALGMGPAYGRARGTSACVDPRCLTEPQVLGCGYPGAPCPCDDAVQCNVNQDCPPGESCRLGGGDVVGLPGANVCMPSQCPGGACGDETSLCGKCACTPNCASKQCGDARDDGCQGSCGPLCATRQVGCNDDADCSAGNVCVIGGAPRVGGPSGENACLPTECLSASVKPPTCGTTTATCGVCPEVPVTACYGRECGRDPTTGAICGPQDVPCIQGKIVAPFSLTSLNLETAQRLDSAHRSIEPLPFDEEATNESPGAVVADFSVDARGSAKYHVPIVVPPGRAGMTPEISLDYSSRGKNGIAGTGWAIGGLSSIGRCPKTSGSDGWSDGIKYDDSDAVCLDGQRLIWVSGSSSSLTAGAKYRTEIDSGDKIVVMDGGAGLLFFRRYAKNGRIYDYGANAQSRMTRDVSNVFLGGGTVVKTWALSTISDRIGNFINFEYGKPENGVVHTPLISPHDIGEYFVTSIAYGGVRSPRGNVDHSRVVVFEYNDDAQPRSDYLEGFTPSGSRVTRTKRLNVIRTAISNQEISTYQLNYETAPTGIPQATALVDAPTGPSRLTSLAECSKKNGVPVCMRPTQFTYSDERGFDGTVRAVPFLDPDDAYGPLIKLDFNGDGRDDFMVPRFLPLIGHVWAFMLNTGDPRAPTFRELTAPSLPLKVHGGTSPCFSADSVTDLNGDGRDEVVNLCRDKDQPFYRYYWLAGDDANPSLRWSDIPVSGTSFDTPRASLVDVDGDGFKDIYECVKKDGSAMGFSHVYRALGGGAFESVATGEVGPSSQWGQCYEDILDFDDQTVTIPRSPILTHDVTGDGQAEVLMWRRQIDTPSGGSEVHLAGWGRYSLSASGVGRWDAVTLDPLFTNKVAATGAWKFLDVNGDGLADLTFLNNGLKLALNVGGRLAPSISFPAAGTGASLLARLTAFSVRNAFGIDFDGDGSDDLLSMLEPKTGDPTSAAGYWLWHRANSNVDNYNTLTLDTAPLDLNDPNRAFLTVQPSVALGSFNVADIDGDGSADLVVFGSDGKLTIAYGKFGHENLLASVVDGLGKRIDIHYDANTPFADGTSGATYASPAGCSQGGDGAVRTQCIKRLNGLVSSHDVTAENVQPWAGNTDVHYRYRYKDARQGFFGRGWLGFGETDVEKSQAATQDQVIESTVITRDNTTFVDSGKLYPFAGFERSRFTTTPFAQSSAELEAAAAQRSIAQTWELGTSALGGALPFLRNVVTLDYERTVSGAVAKVEVTNRQVNTIDQFGNERDVSVTTFGGTPLVERTILTDYDTTQSRIDNWLISLRTGESVEEEVFGTASAQPDVTRTNSWSYDDLGLLSEQIREPDAAVDPNLPPLVDPSLYRKTTFTRTADPFLNVRRISVSGSWGKPDDLQQGTRTSSFQYDADGITTRRVIRHVGSTCPVDSALTDASDSGFGNGCHIDDVRYDPRDGSLLGRVNAAGVGARSAFDAFGRIRQTVDASSSVVVEYLDAEPIFDIFGRLVPARLEVAVVNQTTGAESHQYLDALGRLVQTEVTGLDAQPLFQEFRYQVENLTRDITRPHLEFDSSQGKISVEYDERWRVKRKVNADETATTFLYGVRGNLASPFAIEGTEQSLRATSDPMEHVSTQYLDFRGRPLRSVDATSLATRYMYDAFGTLGSITDSQGNVTTIATDRIGRMTAHSDLDTGTELYGYTVFDQVFTHKEAIGSAAERTRTLSYDALGRLTSEVSPDGTTSRAYDTGPNSMGRLVESVSPTNEVEHFDFEPPPVDGNPLANAARLQGVTRLIDGSVFESGVSYNGQGLVSRIEYPASSSGNTFAAAYAYDSVGNFSSITATRPPGAGAGDDSPVWSRTGDYNGLLLADETFGNQVATHYGFDDDTGRPTTINTLDHDGNALQEIEYENYDDNGNLTDRVTSTRNPVSSQLDTRADTFGYDSLDRLNLFTEGGQVLSVGYDDLGNVTSKDGVGDYHYSETGGAYRPHAVQGIYRSGVKVADLDYDDFGNVKHRSGEGVPGGSQEITYTDFNLPKHVTVGVGNELAYHYNAAHQRALTIGGDCSSANNPGCSKRVYAGNGYERQTATDANGAFARHSYKIFAGSRQVAQIEREVRNGATTETRRYLHGDHLGSAQILSDGAGHAIDVRTFSPQGELRSAIATDAASKNVRSGFTGHETDYETGLVNMRGRTYDPRLSRFMQADPPFAESPMWSQGLNRYSYVFNNPLSLVDPFGFDASLGSDNGKDPVWTFDDDPLTGIPPASAASPTPASEAEYDAFWNSISKDDLSESSYAREYARGAQSGAIEREQAQQAVAQQEADWEAAQAGLRDAYVDLLQGVVKQAAAMTPLGPVALTGHGLSLDVLKSGPPPGARAREQYEFAKNGTTYLVVALGTVLGAGAGGAGAGAEGFSAVETSVVNDVRGFVNGGGLQQLRSTLQAGGGEVGFGGRTIIVSPDMPMSGMTLGNDFAVGQAAFASDAELTQTLLHETYRISAGQSASGVAQGAVTQYTSDAWAFAARAYGAFFGP